MMHEITSLKSVSFQTTLPQFLDSVPIKTTTNYEIALMEKHENDTFEHCNCS